MQVVNHATLKLYQVQMFTDNMVRFVGNGHRLSVIRWKSSTNKETGVTTPAKSAMCVSLPKIEFAIEPECLRESVNDYLEAQQDLIVRQQIDKWFAEHSNVILSEIYINPELVSVEGLQVFHASNSIGGKLSEELIKSWFDEVLYKPLEERIALLPGINDTTLKAAMMQHRDLLAKLASPKASFNERIADQMIKAINTVNEDSMVKASLLRKLNGFKMKDEELLAVL
jgi:hypothetical protein